MLLECYVLNIFFIPNVVGVLSYRFRLSLRVRGTFVEYSHEQDAVWVRVISTEHSKILLLGNNRS